ncbi:MAG: Crp/Fnr family transcriptional regulator [Chitinophagaceae bacterium]
MQADLYFYTYLQQFIPLEQNEFVQLIQPYIKHRYFQKKELLTEKGGVENYINFVVDGLVRKFYRSAQDEITLQISNAGHFIHVQESFHTQTRSEFYIEAIEPSTFVSISFEDLEKIYSSNPKMERLGRLVITHTTILRDKWHMQMIKLTPRERFLRFVKHNPDLLKRVPQKYLASYLNIQPETFSRFKHMLRSVKKASA